MIGSPVQIRIDSESTNPDSMQNNRTNKHKAKINTKSKLKNTIKKSEHVSKYVFRERGVTVVCLRCIKKSTKMILQDKPVLIVDTTIFPLPISLPNQPYLGTVVLMLRCQNKITEENFKIYFPLLILNMIIRTPKIRGSRIYIPFNFCVVSISIMYLPQK